MKVILGSLLLVALVSLVVLVFTKREHVENLVGCYEKSIEAMQESSIIFNRTFNTEKNICLDKKDKIMDAYSCFAAAEAKINSSNLEIDLLKTIAKGKTQASRSIDEVIEDFNRLCLKEEVQITDYELEMISFGK